MRRLSRTNWNLFFLFEWGLKSFNEGKWQGNKKKRFCSMLHITLNKSWSTRGASHQLSWRWVTCVCLVYLVDELVLVFYVSFDWGNCGCVDIFVAGQYWFSSLIMFSSSDFNATGLWLSPGRAKGVTHTSMGHTSIELQHRINILVKMVKV